MDNIDEVAAQNTVTPAESSVDIEYGYPDQSIFAAAINDKGQPGTPMTVLAEALLTRAGLSWIAYDCLSEKVLVMLRLNRLVSTKSARYEAQWKPFRSSELNALWTWTVLHFPPHNRLRRMCNGNRFLQEYIVVNFLRD